MLAVAGDPPVGAGWAVEFKHDGQRALASVTPGELHIVSRNGNPLNASYPELGVLTEAAQGRAIVLDGEIVALRAGRPDFAALQSRMHRQRPSPALVANVPCSYIVFDVLALDGQNLTAVSYADRRGVLASLDLTRPPQIQVPPHYTDLGVDVLLPIAAEHGLEGVIAKRLASRYRPGRSSEWVKVPLRRTGDVVLGGWVPGTGRWDRVVGSLLCGMHDQEGHLVYVGRVGTGLKTRDRDVLATGLAELELEHSPFTPPVPHSDARGARWVQPDVVAEIDYRELTVSPSGRPRLRHPSWRGLRTDIVAAQVRLPAPLAGHAGST